MFLTYHNLLFADAGLQSSEVGALGRRILKKTHTQQCVLAHWTSYLYICIIVISLLGCCMKYNALLALFESNIMHKYRTNAWYRKSDPGDLL